jgi:glycerol-3-phosphate dehydrogenase
LFESAALRKSIPLRGVALFERLRAGGGVVRRSIAALAEEEYDLVIIGGGIFGICAAWDATLRGLSVAVVESGDFAHATSANCFKIVHGGIRYLQHADLVRIRASSRERNAFLRMAPHLVQRLPIVIPTYGHGMRGKEILRAALYLYGLLTFDRNRGIQDPHRQIPAGYLISRQEVLDLFPGLERVGLTGAAVVYDGHMYSPPRLALAFLRSAVEAGAQAANYVRAIGLLRSRDRIYGIEAKDTLTGDQLKIHGKVVLNAAGPWAERLLRRQMGLRLTPEGTYSRDACFAVGRCFKAPYALAVQGKTRDPDALLSRKHRHLFLVPWRAYTLVGVWHVVYTGEPDEYTVTEEELQGFLDEINEAYPALGLTLDDVSMWNAGLVPFGENRPGAVDLSYGKRSRLIDHAKAHGIDGLMTLIGVRYTTARGEAARAIDLVFAKLGKIAPQSPSPATSIYGGQIEYFEEFLRRTIEQRPLGLSAEVMRALLHNHGSQYRDVLKYIDEDPGWAETVGASTVLTAEVVHAVREEMAQKLGDVVFRRTDLGTGGYPGAAALRKCAAVMARELGWDRDRIQKELAEVEAAFPRALRSHHNGIERQGVE